MARIPKAIGLMIPIALVRDSCRKKVKINPKRNIDRITPNVTNSPMKIIVFLGACSETREAIIDRKPGYNGRTQTANIGAESPARNESQKFSKVVILTRINFLF